MTYREKIKNSTVIKEGIMPKYYFGVMSSKKRKRSIITFLLIALYTVATKFIFKTIESFDFMYVVLIANLVFLFILKLISNSLFKLNHFNLYQVVFFLSRLCKLIIFVSTFLTSTEYFSKFFEAHYLALGQMAKDRVNILGYDFTYANELFKYDGEFVGLIVEGLTNNFNFEKLNNLITEYNMLGEIIPYISRLVSIVLFVPVFFYFLGANLRYIFKFIKWTIIACIPFINIIYYLKWLFVVDDLFIAHRESEDKRFIVRELRKLNPDAAKAFKSEIRGIRFLESIGIALIYVAIIFIISNVTNNVNQMVFSIR